MSDEAHFHLAGYVNKQNFRYWADSNLKNFMNSHYTAHHRCAVSLHGDHRISFFKNEKGITVTITSAQYIAMLQTFVAPALNNFLQLHEA